MKYLFSIIVLTAAFAFTLSGNKKEYTDVSGLWRDSNSTSFTNGYMIISQTEDKVLISHYVEFNGVSMIEEGKGTVKGNKVTYNVTVTKAIPGWATSGTHYLEWTDNGSTLRGIYKDAKGNTGPIVFKKHFSKK